MSGWKRIAAYQISFTRLLGWYLLAAISLHATLASGFEVKPAHSGQCLHIDILNLGGRVIQWPCNGEPNQDFERVESGDGSFMLRNPSSGLCMDVAGGNRELGGGIIMWTCQGSANQRLAFYGSGNANGSSFRFQHSGLCMDVAGGRRESGTTVLQWACAFQENQRFGFVEPSTPSSESFEQSTRKFRNVMVINERVNEGGRFLHRLDERLMLRLEYAFTETFPALINELTDGLIQFENSVVRNPQTIFINRRRTEGDCGVWAAQVPNWGDLVGPTGTYDVAYIQNPQTCWMWAAAGGGFQNSVDGVHVGVTTVSRRTDLEMYDDALAGWTHEFLHVVGESFYRDILNVPRVPCVHCGSQFGYDRYSGPKRYRDWQQWYADYLNRNVRSNNQGLGEPAFKEGSLRDYLLSRYQRRNLRGNATSYDAREGPVELDGNADGSFSNLYHNHTHNMHPLSQLT